MGNLCKYSLHIVAQDCVCCNINVVEMKGKICYFQHRIKKLVEAENDRMSFSDKLMKQREKYAAGCL